MSEQLYSIKESTLTGIGDALRRRHGETEIVEVVTEEIVDRKKISKTPNATGFETFEGAHPKLTTGESVFDVVTISGASSIKVKMYAQTWDASYYCTFVFKGEVNELPEDISWTKGYGGGSSYSGYREFTFSGDTVTFCFHAFVGIGICNYLGYYAEVTGYDADGNEITSGETITIITPTEIPRVYTSDEMAEAIDDIMDAPTKNELTFGGNCYCKFNNGSWDWVITKYKDYITTCDINNAEMMFQNSSLEAIPFELNFDKSKSYHNCARMFQGMNKLKVLPTLNNFKPDRANYLVAGCYHITEIPDEFIDSIDWSYAQSYTYSQNGYMHESCYSLRTLPYKLYEILADCEQTTASYMYTYNLFNNCCSLDEVVNLPVILGKTMTSNMFANFVNSAARLKNMTFKLDENNQPFVVDWKSQTLDFTSNTGYCTEYTYGNITAYSSGITTDKRVNSDETYQALKDDPDWFSTKIEYSRYNKESAIATINSLPDTSAYLASAGGTNTIKFKGAAGSKTDGGAINTMTEEEIAVATAKGWTVTFV